MTDATERQLIDACNLLCEYIGGRLPGGGWEIRLSMCRGEASVSLIDPSGDEIAVDSPDYGVSTLSGLCDAANEIEASRPDQDAPDGYHDEPD